MTSLPTATTTPNVEFIAAGDPLPVGQTGGTGSGATVGDLPSEEVITRTDWEATITMLAERPGAKLTVPRSPDLKREQVVNAFLDAFELIGGTPRLAIWADDNLGEFYKLYAKLLPKQLEQEVQHDGGITIKHVLPRGALDQ